MAQKTNIFILDHLIAFSRNEKWKILKPLLTLTDQRQLYYWTFKILG